MTLGDSHVTFAKTFSHGLIGNHRWPTKAAYKNVNFALLSLLHHNNHLHNHRRNGTPSSEVLPLLQEQGTSPSTANKMRFVVETPYDGDGEEVKQQDMN